MTNWILDPGWRLRVFIRIFLMLAVIAAPSTLAMLIRHACNGRNVLVNPTPTDYSHAEQICKDNSLVLFQPTISGPDLTSEFTDCGNVEVLHNLLYWINGKTGSDCKAVHNVSGVVTALSQKCQANLMSVCGEPYPACGWASSDPHADISYPDGTRANYTCHVGYMHSTQRSKISYCSNGQWTHVRDCTAVDCGYPPSIPNAASTDFGPFNYNSTATFTCGPGYTIANPTIRCQEDGTWSQPSPVCNVVVIPVCQSIADPSHGHGVSDHQSAQFFCNPGYAISDPSPLVCLSNNSWNGSVPTCSPVDCGSPPYVANSQKTSTGTTFLKSTTYTCNTGFKLGGTRGTIHCTDSTSWQNPPTCDVVNCGRPSDITHGTVQTTRTTYSGIATHTCDIGYTLTGNVSRTCQTNGTWSRTLPVCKPVDCGRPSDITHGIVQTTRTTYSGIATHTCRTGYTLTGDVSRTCQANGNWSGKEPGCIPVNCNSLPNITHGSVHVDNTAYLGIATYNCEPGYTLTVNATRTCQANGNWSGKEPGCIPVNCNSLPNIIHGSVHVDNTTYLGIAAYNCEPGYILTGNASRTCQANGSWSGATPICKLAGCRLINDPHANVTYTDGTNFGSTALYTCHTGYTINNIQAKYGTCGTDGKWPYGEKCRQVDCGNLSDINHGSVGTTSTAYYGIATYTCGPGYALLGNHNRICQTNGAWSGNEPVCGPVDCNLPPNITDGSVRAGNTTYLDVATYSCNPGYTLSGDENRTCQENGTWGGVEPECDPVDCNLPQNITHGSIQMNNTTYLGVATYDCDPGYMLSGDVNRTCGENGTWSGNEPYCYQNNYQKSCRGFVGRNLEVNTTSISFNTVVAFRCVAGFHVVGNQTLTCRADGSWSDQVPTCEPDVPKQTMCQSIAAPSHGHVVSDRQSAKFICDPGYAISDPSPLACLSNNSWNGSVPTCSPVDCGSPPDVPNSRSISTGTTFLESTTYTCNAGFKMNGASVTIHCTDSKSWETPPSCDVVRKSDQQTSNYWEKSGDRTDRELQEVVRNSRSTIDCSSHCSRVPGCLMGVFSKDGNCRLYRKTTSGSDAVSCSTDDCYLLNGSG